MLMITPAGVVVTRIYTVSDAPPLPKNDSRNTLVNPSRVEVTFRNGQPVKLVISGPYRKRDGSPGAKLYQETYDLVSEGSRRRLPEWVRPLVVHRDPD